MFRIDPADLISAKAQLSKEFSIAPSEVDRMPFWEFELYIKSLERLAKEERDQQEDQLKRSGAKDAMNMANPGKIQKMMSQPKMPNISFPKNINMPNYK